MVLDEVHYLADRFRGAVWEEVIIHLPESVRVVALSATVSNAEEEFGDAGPGPAGPAAATAVIVDEHRPGFPLWQHMLARRCGSTTCSSSRDPATGPGPAGTGRRRILARTGSAGPR